MIIDYSFWRPTALPGVNGVVRYLSHDAGKAVDAAELAWHHQDRRATALVFEDAGERAAEGAAAGTADGQFCAAAARRLGVPPGRTIYAAVDFDAPDYAPGNRQPLAKLGPVGAYLMAFRRALGLYELGVYGSFYVCERASQAGVVRKTWQTVAWSGGQLLADATLYQPGTKVFGDQADVNLAGWRDWGQWRREVVELVGGAA